MKKVRFYGLLYVEKSEDSSLILKDRNKNEQFDIYLKNAEVLSNSLNANGYEFCLLTNSIDLLGERAVVLDLAVELDSIPFFREVPSGTRFYAAHFKLDVFRYFSTLDGQYSILCDLDMLCLGRIPRSIQQVIEKGLPTVYDITEQVSLDYGDNVVVDDLDRVLGRDSLGHWYGGEYIGGEADFFLRLSREVDFIYPGYIKIIDELDHVGDEAVTSAAIDEMIGKGEVICAVGGLMGVGRYWNCGRLLAFQRHFAFFERVFLLHLPNDKVFLSTLVDCDAERLLSTYKRYRVWSLKALKNMMLRMLRRLGV